MKLHRFAPTVAIAMAASFTLAACGNDDPTGAATEAEEGSDDSADAGSDESADAGSEEGSALSGQLAASGVSSRPRYVGFPSIGAA